MISRMKNLLSSVLLMLALLVVMSLTSSHASAQTLPCNICDNQYAAAMTWCSIGGAIWGDGWYSECAGEAASSYMACQAVVSSSFPCFGKMIVPEDKNVWRKPERPDFSLHPADA